MICKNCRCTIPNGSEVCPACNTPTKKKVNIERKLLKFVMLGSDFFIYLSLVVNIFILFTGSHYLASYQYGILYEKRCFYAEFPALFTIDIIFAVLLVLFPLFSVLARYNVNLLRRTGAVFTLISFCVALLWSVFYALSVMLTVGFVSPILPFLIPQISVTFVLGVAASTFLFSSDMLV